MLLSFFTRICSLTTRIYRDPSDKETILNAFTILIGHAPWLKEAMTAAIEDKPLLRRIEQYVSLCLTSFPSYIAHTHLTGQQRLVSSTQ